MTTIVEFIKAGTSSWKVPQGVTSVKVECLGPGGNGAVLNGSAGANARRRGGRGGGYASSTIAVQPEQTLPVSIGAGGSEIATWFARSDLLLAAFGNNALTTTATPTIIPAGIGEIVRDGGAGGSMTGTGSAGGGGAAGPNGNGGDGGGNTSQIGSGGGGANGGSAGIFGGSTLGNAGYGGNNRLGVGGGVIDVPAFNGGGGLGGQVSGSAGATGSMDAIWTATTGEIAGPCGGGGGARTSNGGSGGMYGGGGGGGGGASGSTFLRGYGGDGLIVLTYTIEQSGFSYSYWL